MFILLFELLLTVGILVHPRKQGWDNQIQVAKTILRVGSTFIFSSFLFFWPILVGIYV